MIGEISPEATIDDIVKLLTEKGVLEDNETLRAQVEAALAARDLKQPEESGSGDKQGQAEPEGESESESTEESLIEEADEETTDESETIEEPSQPEKPLAETMSLMWDGDDGVIRIVEAAINEGKFKIY